MMPQVSILGVILMRSLIPTVSLILAVEGTSYGVSPTTISIDGDFSDWDTVSTVVTDASGDTPKPGTDILEFKLTHDLTY